MDLTAIELTKRSYAVGIQEFEHFRTKGSVYIDKTSYVWKMVSADAKNFFLSRPRRFGKSLLISTLHAYFAGRKELFEGLAISQWEKEWVKYPVVRLNLSAGKYYELDRMHVTYRHKEYVVELKIWRGEKYAEHGRDQLAGYLKTTTNFAVFENKKC